MADEEFDIGPNLEEVANEGVRLGFFYVFVRYVLPILAALGIIVILAIFLVWFLHFAVSNPVQFMPAR